MSTEDIKAALLKLPTCGLHHVVLKIERFDYPGHMKQVSWCPLCASKWLKGVVDVQVTFKPQERIVLDFSIQDEGVVFENAEKA